MEWGGQIGKWLRNEWTLRPADLQGSTLTSYKIGGLGVPRGGMRSGTC